MDPAAYEDFTFGWVQATADAPRPGGQLAAVTGRQQAAVVQYAAEKSGLNSIAAWRQFALRTTRRPACAHWTITVMCNGPLRHPRRVFDTPADLPRAKSGVEYPLDVWLENGRADRPGLVRYDNSLPTRLVQRLIEMLTGPERARRRHFTGATSTPTLCGSPRRGCSTSTPGPRTSSPRCWTSRPPERGPSTTRPQETLPVSHPDTTTMPLREEVERLAASLERARRHRLAPLIRDAATPDAFDAAGRLLLAEGLDWHAGSCGLLSQAYRAARTVRLGGSADLTVWRTALRAVLDRVEGGSGALRLVFTGEGCAHIDRDAYCAWIETLLDEHPVPAPNDVPAEAPASNLAMFLEESARRGVLRLPDGLTLQAIGDDGVDGTSGLLIKISPNGAPWQVTTGWQEIDNFWPCRDVTGAYGEHRYETLAETALDHAVGEINAILLAGGAPPLGTHPEQAR